jgi:hypothetical protein
MANDPGPSLRSVTSVFTKKPTRRSANRPFPDGSRCRIILRHQLDDVNCDSESVRAGACQWLRQFLDESAFAAIPSSEASPLAISYGVLSLHGLGTLEEALNRRRTDFAEYLRRCQDPSNGYFIDRRSDFLAADSRKNEGEYLDRRVTYFALLALHVLKAKAPHP